MNDAVSQPAGLSWTGPLSLTMPVDFAKWVSAVAAIADPKEVNALRTVEFRLGPVDCPIRGSLASGLQLSATDRYQMMRVTIDLDPKVHRAQPVTLDRPSAGRATDVEMFSVPAVDLKFKGKDPLTISIPNGPRSEAHITFDGAGKDVELPHVDHPNYAGLLNGPVGECAPTVMNASKMQRLFAAFKKGGRDVAVVQVASSELQPSRWEATVDDLGLTAVAIQMPLRSPNFSSYFDGRAAQPAAA